MTAQSLKLGKKRGIVHDDRTAHLAFFLDSGVLPTPPAATGTGSTVTEWPMYNNDVCGDCGLASNGHRIIAQERSALQKELIPTTEDVIRAYSAISGYDPATGANDNGVYLLDVCNYMRNVGLGREADGTPHKIYAFAKVDHRNMAEVKTAAWLFGGLYVGAGLPVSAAYQLDKGQKWHLDNTVPTDQRKRYSWGGHALYMTGYDALDVGFITWGARQKATWNWWRTYVDEAYAFVTEDYFKSSGVTPRGFDLDKMDAYLRSL